MNTRTIHYSRPLTTAFFSDATHEDLKWTINYLIGLLESPEKVASPKASPSVNDTYSERIQRLMAIPKVHAIEAEDDPRLENILSR